MNFNHICWMIFVVLLLESLLLVVLNTGISKIKRTIPPLLISVVNATFAKCFSSIDATGIIIAAVQALPVWLDIVILFIDAVLLLILHLNYNSFIKNRVTRMSLKQGLDWLPEGICIYSENGVILLKNHTMDAISLKLWGHLLLNGLEFWKGITGGQTRKNHALIDLDNGRIWEFNRKKLEDGTYQLFASDVTEEEQLNKELEKNNLALIQLNEKLRDYNLKVDENVKKEEFLATKVRIHDKLGHILLSARKQLESGNCDEETKKKLITEWQQVFHLLQYSDEEQESDTPKLLNELKKATEFLNINLQVKGRIPENFDVKKQRILIAVARECITNAARHSNADTIYMDIEEKTRFVNISFYDNGTNSEKSNVEGGIASLRRLVENEAAVLNVEYSPMYKLTVVFSKNTNK